MQEALATTIFRTGDSDLDRLIETAREKVLNRSPEVRKEGLEKLSIWPSGIRLVHGGIQNENRRRDRTGPSWVDVRFFGLNGFLNFPPAPPLTGVPGAFLGALMTSH